MAKEHIHYDQRLLDFEKKAGLRAKYAAKVLGLTTVHYGNLRRLQSPMTQHTAFSIEAHMALPDDVLSEIVKDRLSSSE